jgi:hypothetical protein
LKLPPGRDPDALTIITTCKKLGIDLRSYIRDTLRRILEGEKVLALLLPENFKSRAGPGDPVEHVERRAA